jgi:hypothetical protein
MPDLVRAAIAGFDRCDAEGHTVRAAAPVLAMCRRLLAAGYDPARQLHAYRGDALALKVRSIGEGAKLTVKDNSCGTPAFRRLYDREETMLPAPPIRYSERPLSVSLST